MVKKLALVVLIAFASFGAAVAAAVGYEWWQNRNLVSRVVVAPATPAGASMAAANAPPSTALELVEVPDIELDDMGETLAEAKPIAEIAVPTTTTPPTTTTTALPATATTTPPQVAPDTPTAAERAAYVMELMTGRVETDESVSTRYCNTTNSGGVGWTLDPDYQWENCLLPDATATVPDAQAFIDTLGRFAGVFVRVVAAPGAITSRCLDAPSDVAGCAKMESVFTIYVDEPLRATLAHEFAHLWETAMI